MADNNQMPEDEVKINPLDPIFSVLHSKDDCGPDGVKAWQFSGYASREECAAANPSDVHAFCDDCFFF